MQTLSVATTENWPACLGHYRRRGDTLLTSAADRRRTSTHYDTNGNLLNKKRYAYVPNGGTLGACLETISYGYDAAHQDWADQLTSYNGETIRYDDSGNPISYRGYTMAWQGKRLTSANKSGTTITYSYDENGIRTQKSVNGVATNYYYNGSLLISMTQGTDTLLFSYDASGNVVSANFNGTDYYYVRNGQGDVIKLIDGSGTTVTEYTYDTWGKLISCTGSLSATLGTLNPFRYRGYVYDNETGFYYLQSRYYDPVTCRFISADVLLSTGQGVLGHNTYAYCGDNPVSRIDSEGQFWNIIVGAIVGTIVGAVSSVVSQVKSGEGIDWGKVALSAGAGAVTGAIAGATLGVGLAVAAAGTTAATIGGAAIAVAGGALASAGGEALNQVIHHGKVDDPTAVIREGIVGGISNLIGFGIGNLVGKAYNSTRAVFKNGRIQVFDTMVETYKVQTASERIISLHLSSISAPLSYVAGHIILEEE